MTLKESIYRAALAQMAQDRAYVEVEKTMTDAPEICDACGGDGTIYIRTYGTTDEGYDVPCRACQPVNPRERGDDDGTEYGDPRDAKEDRC